MIPKNVLMLWSNMSSRHGHIAFLALGPSGPRASGSKLYIILNLFRRGVRADGSLGVNGRASVRSVVA